MNKSYFTVEELVVKAMERAMADPRKKTVIGDVPLTCVINRTTANRTIISDNFDPVGQTMFPAIGGGVVGEISLFGPAFGRKRRRNDWPLIEVARVSTPRDDEDAYLSVGAYANLICYYIKQIMNENPDRFN